MEKCVKKSKRRKGAKKIIIPILEIIFGIIVITIWHYLIMARLFALHGY